MANRNPVLSRIVAKRRVTNAKELQPTNEEVAMATVKSIVPMTRWVTSGARREISSPPSATNGTESADMDGRLAPVLPFSPPVQNNAPACEQVQTVSPPNIPDVVPATKCLDRVVAAAIMFSTFMLGLETDHAPLSMEPKDRIVWIVSESIIILVFFVEIFVRMSIERWNWPCTIWNWFDVIVLVLIMVETWILSFIKNGQLLREQNGLQVLGLVQVVRLGRFLKVLKIFRVMRFVQATVATFRDSIAGLFAVGLLMLAGVWVCAIFMTQTVGRTRLQYTEFSDGYTASERFGSVPRSIWTLFEIMTLEQWQVTGRPLVEAEPVMALFFCAYIMVFTFGLLNMGVAVIVDYALKQARRMFEVDVEEMQTEVAMDLKVMDDAFKECDTNNDGTIYRSEFVETVDDKTGALAACLTRLDIPTEDALALFDILDTNMSGGITPDEFLDGCARVLGASDPRWDELATHSSAVDLSRQFHEFRDYMEQTLGFTSSKNSPSSAAMVQSQSSSPSVRQPGKRNVWGYPGSNRKHVQPSRHQEPEAGSQHLAPEFVTWQEDTAWQLRLNEQLLTQLNKDMMDEIVQERAFLERLANVERRIQLAA